MRGDQRKRVNTVIVVEVKVTKTSTSTEDTEMNLLLDPGQGLRSLLKKISMINRPPKNHTSSRGCSKTTSNKGSEELLKKMSRVT